MKRRDMGELDAQQDNSFEEHFVESNELRQIIGPQSDIIFGAKGVGKTALRRALMEIYQENFISVTNIDLDEVSFQQIHRALSDLRDTSQAGIDRLASSAWLNVLAIYSLEAVAKVLDEGSRLRIDIDSFLKNDRIQRKRPNERLLDHIERLFLRLGKAGLDRGERRLWLNPSALDLVHRFPCSTDFEELLIESRRFLKQKKRPTLVCLDGFDSIAEHTAEQREVIFTGLIDAVQKAMKNPLFKDTFCFKAFLPQELTNRAKATVWDSDKYGLRTHLITWNVDEFKRLLTRRFQRFARTKSERFLDLWLDSMPESIHNSAHRIDEHTFDYILRHTQYRPRQFLQHLQRIFDAWDRRSDSFRVDASIIPKIVSNTNRELSNFVVAQIAPVNPVVSSFVQSLRGGSSVMSAGFVRQIVQRVFSINQITDVNVALDELFDFGIVGYQKANEMQVNSRRQAFHFSFVGDCHVPNLHAAIDDHDYIALCPMFVDFCGCANAKNGAVVPIEM